MNVELHDVPHPRREQLLKILRALSDPVRLDMVHRLAADGGPDRPCKTLYEGLAKSTASYHLTILRDCGLLETYPDRGQTLARLRRDVIDELSPELLDAVLHV
jgi:DNA-binding transcriptional ArsR family regulator